MERPKYVQLIILVFIMLISINGGNCIMAQTGRWVEYPVDDYPGVSQRMSTGTSCAVYTRQNSERIIIFDLRVGEWQEFELIEPQFFNGVKSEGEIVFAHSDSILFAYSSLVNAWDTATFHGDIVFPCDTCFGCGNNIAYFMADDLLYVFDAALGHWQTYDYGGYLDDYFTCYPWVKDNYLAFAINRGSGLPYKNIVYSHITHGFNETDVGLFKPNPLMNYGFSGLIVEESTGDYVMIGYSALTNSFSTATYTSDWYHYATFNIFKDRADLFTTGFHTFTYANQYDDIETVFYGYDTRSGNWNTYNYTFEHGTEIFLSSAFQAGQFGYDNSTINSTGELHFFFFDGIAGQFHDHTPGIEYKSTTTSYSGGGTTFIAHDSLQAWGYDTKNNRSSLINVPLAKTANFNVRENFGTLTRWSPTVDTMIIFFYNSDNNSWSSVSLPDDHTSDGMISTGMYFFCAEPGNKAIFYGADADAIFEADFPDDASYLGYIIRGDLAYIRSENMSVLFDGTTGLGHTFNFEFDQFGLGQKSAVFCDQSTNTCYGYSTVTESIAANPVSGDHFLAKDTGYIGYAIYDYHSNPIFYTFNGLTGYWVLLEPEGNLLSRDIGNKTALVATDTKVYVFDPENDPTEIVDSEENKLIPEKVELSQNFPNPFNNTTIIEFYIPTRTRVILDIYNILGQKVVRLVDDIHPAGSYNVVWNGTDAAGHQVSSGIYFYHIKTESNKRTKRMLLIK